MKWNKNAASQKGRVFRSGLLSTAMLAAVLVLAVLLNLLVRAIPAKYTEFDLSEAKMYTLSDSTKALVEGLEKDVHIYYLCETGSEDTIITKLLHHYAAESGQLISEQKDPTLYKTFAAKYGAETVYTGSLIVTCGDKLALYGADIISKAVKNFEDRSYARVFGIVLNHRNVENETEKVETFAKEHGFDIVGEIPRSDEINRCEDQGKTVIEGNPESDISKCFYDLAEILWKDEEQV